MIPLTVCGDVTCADAPVTSHAVIPIALATMSGAFPTRFGFFKPLNLSTLPPNSWVALDQFRAEFRNKRTRHRRLWRWSHRKCPVKNRPAQYPFRDQLGFGDFALTTETAPERRTAIAYSRGPRSLFVEVAGIALGISYYIGLTVGTCARFVSRRH
jgi:hypothetical protein